MCEPSMQHTFDNDIKILNPKPSIQKIKRRPRTAQTLKPKV